MSASIVQAELLPRLRRRHPVPGGDVPKCGVRQKSMPVGGGRTRTSAAIFALFLGGLGVHKFYLGQPGLGVLYLLFCWTFVPSVVGFIEAIVYLSMTDQSFNARYNQTM